MYVSDLLESELAHGRVPGSIECLSTRSVREGAFVYVLDSTIGSRRRSLVNNSNKNAPFHDTQALTVIYSLL